MKSSWTVIALAALVVSATPALARGKYHRLPPQCVDRPYEFSWFKFFFGPAPEPNGCAPPVFSNGNFVGQDPDPFIRYGLRRDPQTGYENADKY